MTLRKIIKRLGRVKTELAVLPVLVFLAVMLGSLLVRWPHEKDTEININEYVEESPKVVSNVSVTPKVLTSETDVSIEDELEEVVLIIEREGYKESWQVGIKEGSTVEEVLDLAKVNGYLDVEITDYGGSMGVFIESLDGVSNNNIEKIYWRLYVNDVLSPVGATQATVNAGDRVIWKYDKQYEENE